MQYRATRRHKRMGWPEVWLVISIALAVAPATVWWRTQYQPEWRTTAGEITSSTFTRVHYNAQDYRVKVQASYTYTAGLVNYAGSFDGFWPEVGSPNAHAPEDVERLVAPRAPVAVYYNPAYPARSTLYRQPSGASPLWPVLTAAGLCVAGAYTLIVYRAWRA